MITKNKIILAIIALVLLGGAGVAYSKNSARFSKPFSNKSAFNTIQDAVNSGKSLKCELVQTLSGQTNRVTVYTQNGNVKEEVSSAVGTAHVLINKDFTYMWNTKAPGVSKIPGQLAQQSNALILKTKIASFTCVEQALPASLFSPPR
jgi:hypothetical protein